MNTEKEYIAYINKALSEIHYPAQPKGLYEPIAYTLDCGGKRIRPMLMLAAAEALGADKSVAVNQAVGLEMFHNFTLLHDDVMDRADVRRGRPTVHVKWNEATAILSGDAMLTMASQFMGRGCPGRLAEVLDLFNRTAMEIYEGQQYDMDFENREDVTVAEYIEMIRLKTSVLLGCACRMGALMAGADEAVQKAFYDYGTYLGLAFQLRDDWLDTYGDPAVFGKKIGGDILNDKKTILLITALNRADGKQKARLTSLFGTRSEEKIAEVMAIYDALDVESECRAMINDYSEKAIACLEKAGLSSDAFRYFVDIAERSLNRKS